ncbi:MAG: EutN/CcmL family microcompartment protein [Gemmatimonadota bacterium]
MRLCRVVGHVVASVKHPSLAGRRILVVSAAPGKGDPSIPMQLAVDGVGAGIGCQVMISESGAAGAEITGFKYPPVRSVIVGIVDQERGAS